MQTIPPIKKNYTPDELLKYTVEELLATKNDMIVNTWFGSAKAVGVYDNMLIIYTNNFVICDTLKKRFTENVTSILRYITGDPMIPLYICTEEDLEKWSVLCGVRGSMNYTFENFVVGNSNKFAHAAALAVSRNPGGRNPLEMFNPLYIYGPSGLGKTHLLHAISAELTRTRPETKVAYIKAEDFTNEMVDSIARSSTAKFRDKYRNVDLLMVDDIQFIAGKKGSEDEFFHTFDSLYEAKKQIVLTADRPPKEMYSLTDRLRTRFEWGLLADIQPPDYETRLALVESKANMMGITLTQDVKNYIATVITSNVRQLEGVVKKIGAVHNMLNTPVDMTMAQYVIKEVFRETPGITPDQILRAVADFYEVEPDKIKGKSRIKEIVLPRQVTIYLIRELTELSFPDIGKFMNRDYSTAIHSIEQIGRRQKEDAALAYAIKDIKRSIQEMPTETIQ